MRKAFSIFFLGMLPAAGVALDYEDDIMPILEKKCAECHSDSEKVKGGFKVDDPEHLLGRLGKNSLVVPGDWDASYLFVTLYRPEGDDDAMPPKGKGERLTPDEVQLVQRWITEGATILGETGEKGEMPKPGEPGSIEAMVAQAGGAVESASESREMMEEKPAGPRDWTNVDGKKITATLLRVEGEVALLRMADGKVYRYPIEKLSEESRAALKTP